MPEARQRFLARYVFIPWKMNELIHSDRKSPKQIYYYYELALYMRMSSNNHNYDMPGSFLFDGNPNKPYNIVYVLLMQLPS